MSRSYKKIPIHTDGNSPTTKISKRYANKKVRNYIKNSDYNLKGNYYKKIFESYDIHDFIIMYSWEEAKEEYLSSPYLQNKYSLKEWYRHWKKTFINK
jgi:adenosine deaminase